MLLDIGLCADASSSANPEITDDETGKHIESRRATKPFLRRKMAARKSSEIFLLVEATVRPNPQEGHRQAQSQASHRVWLEESEANVAKGKVGSR